MLPEPVCPDEPAGVSGPYGHQPYVRGGLAAEPGAGIGAGPAIGAGAGAGTGPLAARGGGRAAVRRAARVRRASERPEVFRKLLPQALVVAFLAGGTSAFVAYDKSVELDVDGRSRTLHTFADDVEELLEDEGVELGSHDTVLPARGAPLSDGDEIAVRYGRPLLLTLDGHRRQVWTTADTVGGALRELGVRAEGARISTSRSAPIGRTGREVEVWTERTLTFLVDGREQRVRTNAATVSGALEDAGIVLRDEDTTSVPLGGFPRDGQTVTVMRITGTEKVHEERLPFVTVRREDPRLLEGTEVVSRQGRPGLRRDIYELRTVNGVRQKPRRTSSEVVRTPRAQVVRVGTKELPDSVEGADGLNWRALAECESGGRPDAVDSSGTYGGLYQFDTGTWRRLGGSGRPQNAPAEEQTMRAKKLYMDRGASPWPVCGRKLSR
ncbi:ubiquitin-like domain-containing protein [Streptomyces iconiensis]|uniref:Ubiquitin-like domain-containing protein n=2 Tax=Streptomyces iconiensis TaxID=1384038 RepID=A0ABT7A535_9ACTN|nr:resuscitation-promoting factor [Streptomyces iconiensis]MDJ1136396.1 ubiquitin-like domain-containing protein [Streptomyces iconiensis]